MIEIFDDTNGTCKANLWYLDLFNIFFQINIDLKNSNWYDTTNHQNELSYFLLKFLFDRFDCIRFENLISILIQRC